MGGSVSGGFDYDKQLVTDQVAQSVEVKLGADEKEEKNCGLPRRNAKFPNRLIKTIGEDEKGEGGAATIWEAFQRGVTKFPNNNMFGTRKWTVDEKKGEVVRNADKTYPRENYVFSKYSEIDKEARQFGLGLLALGVKPKDAIGIYSINRPEWVTAFMGFHSQSLKTVALYATLGPNAVAYIIEHAEVATVVTEKSNLKGFVGLLAGLKKLKTIIQIDYDQRYGNLHEAVDPADVKTFEEKGVRLIGLSEVKKMGADAKEQTLNAPKPDDIAYIMYTSGTTGNPKGAILLHSNVVAAVACVDKVLPLNEKDIHISYLPLAHIFECIVQVCVYSFGGNVGFYSGDVAKLTEDMTKLKPTILCGVPRVFTKIYQKVMQGVSEKNCIVQYYFFKAYNYQVGQARTKQVMDAGYDQKVFQPIRARTGLDNVRIIVSGAAPCPPYCIEFLRVITKGAHVVQGYGMTEGAAGGTITRYDDPNCGHVGPPIPCCEIKLRDIEEMKYLHTDKPCPRGEIMVRGANVFAGYYKNEEATKETVEPGGWLATGDVGRWNPNGTLSIIDRKKNLFKLSQGEYIAAEKVENVYGKCGAVAQVWIYGNSFKSVVMAVVVPNAEAVSAWAQSQGFFAFQGSKHSAPGVFSEAFLAEFEKLITGPKKAEVKKYVADEMAKTAGNELKGFERVKDILLEGKLNQQGAGFNEQNDTLTPTNKLRRPQLLKRYVKELKELYALNGEKPAADEVWPGEK